MIKIVFATNNPNKKLEIQSMLPAHFEIINLEDIGFFDEIPENEPTIAGNAIQKANFITQKFGLDCFADDTGLEVESLNGEPGVFSARYAGSQRNSDDNINKLLENLAQDANRKARFKTVICLNLKGKQHLFEGIVNGTITENKSGTGGFGYDPVFCPNGFDQTFAELPLTLKNKISHRGIATQQLLDFLKIAR